MNTTLDGYPIRVDQTLTGTKTAALVEGVIVVSPAMWELLRNADADELPLLLKAIPLVRISDRPMDPFKMDIPIEYPAVDLCKFRWMF